MDSSCIASLKDNLSTIEKIFQKIDKKLNEYQTAELSSQNIIKKEITKDLNLIQNNISIMEMEQSNLREENIQNEWSENIKKISLKYEEIKQKLQNQENNLIDNDETNIDKKVDLSQLTTQQAINRGDKILNSDRNAINRMNKIINQDIDTMKEVNKELVNQKEKLENADKDLTEIDFSVNRAVQQLKTMFKMYATDKLIMCLIFVIILVIIAIVVIKFIKGDEGDVNKVNDIFTSKVTNQIVSNNKIKFLQY
jgi:chromosome segregation ATPase